MECQIPDTRYQILATRFWHKKTQTIYQSHTNIMHMICENHSLIKPKSIKSIVNRGKVMPKSWPNHANGLPKLKKTNEYHAKAMPKSCTNRPNVMPNHTQIMPKWKQIRSKSCQSRAKIMYKTVPTSYLIIQNSNRYHANGKFIPNPFKTQPKSIQNASKTQERYQNIW